MKGITIGGTIIWVVLVGIKTNFPKNKDREERLRTNVKVRECNVVDKPVRRKDEKSNRTLYN